MIQEEKPIQDIKVLCPEERRELYLFAWKTYVKTQMIGRTVEETYALAERMEFFDRKMVVSVAEDAIDDVRDEFNALAARLKAEAEKRADYYTSHFSVMLRDRKR